MGDQKDYQYQERVNFVEMLVRDRMSKAVIYKELASREGFRIGRKLRNPRSCRPMTRPFYCHCVRYLRCIDDISRILIHRAPRHLSVYIKPRSAYAFDQRQLHRVYSVNGFYNGNTSTALMHQFLAKVRYDVMSFTSHTYLKYI